MKGLDCCNPVVSAIYFITVCAFAMFSMNPFILFISLLGGILLFIMRNGRKNVKTHLFALLIFFVTSFINPLLSHNGKTVLFVINNSPITAESLIYGMVVAAMAVAVIYWFASFTDIMTSDKLLYIFGKLSPKLSLVLSMGMRFVPLFSAQSKKISLSQKAVGLYKKDNLIDTSKGKLRIFSSLTTWVLENGITTADSMAARGYGTGKRSHFSVFRFSFFDFILLAMIFILSVLVIITTIFGDMSVKFYPSFLLPDTSAISIVGYVAYSALSLLPVIIQTEEKLRWKYLISKI